MIKVQNPILKGFNPDPSICKVDDDYYIATSTFEWFPGVQIHHSKDLIHWKLIARPLNRVSQLNMLGVPDSGGVWAPCLSYHKGTFYLIFTNVLSEGYVKDTPNYLVTTDDIYGEWSEPIFLNASGFDPSLFHDDNSRKWLVNMKCDNRIGENTFAGILLQEYDDKNKCLTGPITNIFTGTELGYTEGPHIYKRHGYYYLMTAEGGTGYGHAVTLARSKHLEGPYELHPNNPVLTSFGTDMHTTLQKAGHASIIDGKGDDWFMVHLCSRPLPRSDRCILGRETAIQKVEWEEDDWLYLSNGDHTPQWEIEIDDIYLSDNTTPSDTIFSHFYDFNNEKLDMDFQTLRVPADRFMSLSERPGYLRLYGKESMSSKYTQSLVARRQQSFSYCAETCVEFEPVTSQQLAGLICYYNTQNYYYLRVSTDKEIGGRCIGVLANINGDVTESMLQRNNVCIEDVKRVYLKVEIEYSELKFYYALEKYDWNPIGKTYDASTLSDDAVKISWGFTGAFVGMCCQDLSGSNNHADFKYFYYVENIISNLQPHAYLDMFRVTLL